MQSNIFTSWLHKRGITDEVISQFGLTVCDHGSMIECLRIPVSDETGILFSKYRRNPLEDKKPKYIYDSGSSAVLYGRSQCDAHGAKQILITEGELDALVAWSSNIPAVSSTGGAMTFFPEWVQWFLDGDKDVIVCFDNDAAGGRGMARVVRMLPKVRVMFLPDRPGVKDISDYVAAGGDLHALMRSARMFISKEDVINDMSERKALWKSTFFHDAFIEELEKEERAVSREVRVSRELPEGITDDVVANARNYPIDKLIELNKNKCNCLWHKEKTASLHYYRDSNKLWCFGSCGRGFDAIDVYMKTHNVRFTEAVKALNV